MCSGGGDDDDDDVIVKGQTAARMDDDDFDDNGEYKSSDMTVNRRQADGCDFAVVLDRPLCFVRIGSFIPSVCHVRCQLLNLHSCTDGWPACECYCFCGDIETFLRPEWAACLHVIWDVSYIWKHVLLSHYVTLASNYFKGRFKSYWKLIV